MIAMVLFRGSYGQVCYYVCQLRNQAVRRFSWWGFFGYLLGCVQVFKTKCFFGGGNFVEVSFFSCF